MTAVIVRPRPSTVAVFVKRPDLAASSFARQAKPVLIVSRTGARGAPGVSGSSNNEVIALASATVGGHRAVVQVEGGTLQHFNPATASHHGAVLGVSLNAATSGDEVTVKALGFVTFAGWTWTPGEIVFATTDGVLSHTPDSIVRQPVGVALGATALFVRPEPPIYTT